MAGKLLMPIRRYLPRSGLGVAIVGLVLASTENPVDSGGGSIHFEWFDEDLAGFLPTRNFTAVVDLGRAPCGTASGGMVAHEVARHLIACGTRRVP
jgi:hypothetical protein